MTSCVLAQVYTNSDISEGWVVKCTCGVTADDGRDMIECDTCKTWQHVKCVLGKKRAKALPPGQEFVCTFCRAADDDAPTSKPAQVHPYSDYARSIRDLVAGS